MRHKERQPGVGAVEVKWAHGPRDQSQQAGGPTHQWPPRSLAFISAKYWTGPRPASQLLAGHSTGPQGRSVAGEIPYEGQQAQLRHGCSLTSRPRRHRNSYLLPLPLWHVARALKQGNDLRRMSPRPPRVRACGVRTTAKEPACSLSSPRTQAEVCTDPKM